MQIIPLQSDPSQTLTVNLNGQNCSINVYQRLFGLFLDLYQDGSLVIGGQICQNLNRIVRSSYLGFQGDLAFIDTQGADDPIYSGIGTQFQLLYLSPYDTTVSQEAWHAYVDLIALIPPLMIFDATSVSNAQ